MNINNLIIFNKTDNKYSDIIYELCRRKRCYKYANHYFACENGFILMSIDCCYCYCDKTCCVLIRDMKWMQSAFNYNLIALSQIASLKIDL